MSIRSQHGSQDLSVAEFNQNFSFDWSSKLQTVYVHATVPIEEEIVITYKSGRGSDYDTVIERCEMESEQDFVFMADGSCALDENDAVNIMVSNANTAGTVFVSIKSEKLK